MIKSLILYLNKNDLVKLIFILILTIGSSFFELIGIGSIPIFFQANETIGQKSRYSFDSLEDRITLLIFIYFNQSINLL